VGDGLLVSRSSGQSSSWQASLANRWQGRLTLHRPITPYRPEKTKPARGRLVGSIFAAINEFCAPIDGSNLAVRSAAVEAVPVTKLVVSA